MILQLLSLLFSVAKSARKKYVKIRNDQGHPSSSALSPICVVEPTSSLSIQALANIGDVYASDSEYEHEGIPNDPNLPSVDSVSHDDGSIVSTMPPDIQLSVDPLLQDENSMESISSLSCASSASLSPSTKKIVGILRKFEASKENKSEKTLEKKLDMIHSSVNAVANAGGNLKALDYLTSTNELKDAELKRKDAELAAQKHKTKSQEGKTAAQTRKVNIAVEEAKVARVEAETDRQLYEKAEADKSTLIISNAAISTAMKNLSTGDQVCKDGVSTKNALVDSLCVPIRSKIGNKRMDMVL